jgi:hypothetical protein
LIEQLIKLQEQLSHEKNVKAAAENMLHLYQTLPRDSDALRDIERQVNASSDRINQLNEQMENIRTTSSQRRLIVVIVIT